MSDVLDSLARFIDRRAGLILLVALLGSLLTGSMSRHLSIDTDFSNLLPEERSSVQALDNLRHTIGGESGVAVGIVSPSFEANKRFAEDLIPRAMALGTGTVPDTASASEAAEGLFRRVTFERNVEVLRTNALYFATDRELDRIETFLRRKVQTATRRAVPFSGGTRPTTATDSLGGAIDQTYKRLVGTRYPISDDSTTMGIRFFPSSTNTSVGVAGEMYERMETLVDRLAPASYHPEMKVVLAGRLYRQLAEIRRVRQDITNSFGIGMSVVLLTVVAYFLYKVYRIRCGGRWRQLCFTTELLRAPFLVLVISLPLLLSLIWTGGFASLVFGRLNLMTSTLGLVLFGLGIDYGIHFYGRYAEERANGVPRTEALTTTFTNTGRAIGVGAFTTAGALYVLTAASFKGFSEFGAIAGTGILFALVAMTVVMPALLVLLEQMHLLPFDPRDEASPTIPTTPNASWRIPASRLVVIAGLLAGAAALFAAPSLSFEYDFTALSPDFPEYDRKARIVRRAFGNEKKRRSPAYVITDTAAAVPNVVAALQERRTQDSTGLIRRIESLTERFPLSDSAQQAKLRRIADLRRSLDAIQSTLDAAGRSSSKINRLLRAAQTTEPVPLQALPDGLRQRFTSKNGEIGTFIRIFPSRTLADGRDGIRFKRLVGTVTTDKGTTYHAASTSLVAADMLLLMQTEAPWMIGGTFAVVALLMLFIFRDLRWAGLALVPLVVGLLWMILGMVLFDLKLNFYNMVVLPAILGIGNDAGVHVVHRYREEGPGSLWTVLRSTGEHVTIGTLTTLIGFGGLLVSFHPGLRTIGLLAVVGLVTTLAAAIVFLPALLQWMETHHRPPTSPEASASIRRPDAPQAASPAPRLDRRSANSS
jgi:predicted RND superfamily exporter protein